MRKLTFHRYLERYVYSLSEGKTASISKLAKEVPSNHRLREPLFLYSMSVGKVELLLKASSECPAYSSYKNLANRFDWDNLLIALEKNDLSLGEEYRKTYNSYVRKRDSHCVDQDTKALMHKRIRQLQKNKCVSNYRLYADLDMNPGNVNAFLKNCELKRLSINAVERILVYLEHMSPASVGYSDRVE